MLKQLIAANLLDATTLETIQKDLTAKRNIAMLIANDDYREHELKLIDSALRPIKLAFAVIGCPETYPAKITKAELKAIAKQF